MLTAKAASPHDAILCVSTQGPARAAVRMGEWKLLVNGGAAEADKAEAPKTKGKNAKAAAKYEPVALYHLTDDPGETKNLAAAQPERVKAMRTRLTELLKDAAPSGTEISGK